MGNIYMYLFFFTILHRCGVAGKFSFLCLSTVPVLAVMTINIVLYTLTWYQIRTETKRLSGTSISLNIVMHTNAKELVSSS